MYQHEQHTYFPCWVYSNQKPKFNERKWKVSQGSSTFPFLLNHAWLVRGTCRPKPILSVFLAHDFTVGMIPYTYALFLVKDEYTQLPTNNSN